ncbi:hypothetical protein BJX76DRAFT_362563 [Aspergillus varians]
MLLDRLRITGLDKQDMDHIRDSSSSDTAIPPEARAHVHRIIHTVKFHSWDTRPKPRELLILCDAKMDNLVHLCRAITALLCEYVEKWLRGRDKCVSMIYFCRLHVEPDDAQSGVRAMMRSMICQLLEQYFKDVQFQEQDIDLDALDTGGIEVLCNMLQWLVRQVSSDTRLVCIVDGATAYEGERYKGELWKALDCLLNLVRDETVPATVKVLVACYKDTFKINKAFRLRDDKIIPLEQICPYDTSIFDGSSGRSGCNCKR